MSSAVSKAKRFWVFLGIGVALIALTMVLFLMAISYMERAMVATSLLTSFIGFATLSSSLYVLRLAAYVYGVEVGEGEKG